MGFGEFAGGAAAQGNGALDDGGIVAHRVRAGASSFAGDNGKDLDAAGAIRTAGGSSFGWIAVGTIGAGHALGKAQTLFPRVDKTEAIERIEAMANEELNPHSAGYRRLLQRAHQRAGTAEQRLPGGKRADRD